MDFRKFEIIYIVENNFDLIKQHQLRFVEESWDTQKLGNICKITMGQSPSSSNYSENKEDTVLIQGNADLINGQVVPRVYTSEITKTSKPGDIILTVRAPVGDLAINEFNSCIGRGVCSIEGDKFIYYFLQSLKDKHVWERYSQGSTFESINSNDIKNLKVKMPSEKTQESISNFLTRIDVKIRLLEKKYNHYQDFKKFLMQQIFAQKLRFADYSDDWKEITLKDIGTFYRGHSYNSTNVVDNGLLVLRSNNIQNNVLDFSEDGLQFVDKDCKKELELQKNDIVICMSNGTRSLVGKSAEYTGNYANKLTVGAFCSIFRTKNKLAKYLFQTENYKKNLYLILAGTNINNLKNTDLERFKFNIPVDESEINKIYDLFTSIDNKIESSQKQLQEIMVFKKGLLQQMFVYIFILKHTILNFCAKICCIKYFLKS